MMERFCAARWIAKRENDADLPGRLTLDHVVPRSRGGLDSWENLVWSAKDVNQRKADRQHDGCAGAG